jgi:hypothetical protein
MAAARMETARSTLHLSLNSAAAVASCATGEGKRVPPPIVSCHKVMRGSKKSSNFELVQKRAEWPRGQSSGCLCVHTRRTRRTNRHIKPFTWSRAHARAWRDCRLRTRNVVADVTRYFHARFCVAQNQPHTCKRVHALSPTPPPPPSRHAASKQTPHGPRMITLCTMLHSLACPPIARQRWPGLQGAHVCTPHTHTGEIAMMLHESQAVTMNVALSRVVQTPGPSSSLGGPHARSNLRKEQTCTQV